MSSIHIATEIMDHCPDLELGVISGQIDNNVDLPVNIDDLLSTIEITDPQNDAVIATRKWYKSLGKHPSRYRPSAEALRRRISHGKGLYSVNPAVDIINTVSLTYGFSIGAYDHHKIVGNISLVRGSTQRYEAIARGILNIENLPTLVDENGPFGTPTSDSVRTSITDETSSILIVVYNCNRDPLFTEAINDLEERLTKYCNFLTQ